MDQAPPGFWTTRDGHTIPLRYHPGQLQPAPRHYVQPMNAPNVKPVSKKGWAAGVLGVVLAPVTAGVTLIPSLLIAAKVRENRKISAPYRQAQKLDNENRAMDERERPYRESLALFEAQEPGAKAKANAEQQAYWQQQQEQQFLYQQQQQFAQQQFEQEQYATAREAYKDEPHHGDFDAWSDHFPEAWENALQLMDQDPSFNREMQAKRAEFIAWQDHQEQSTGQVPVWSPGPNHDPTRQPWPNPLPIFQDQSEQQQQFGTVPEPTTVDFSDVNAMVVDGDQTIVSESLAAKATNLLKPRKAAEQESLGRHADKSDVHLRLLETPTRAASAVKFKGPDLAEQVIGNRARAMAVEVQQTILTKPYSEILAEGRKAIDALATHYEGKFGDQWTTSAIFGATPQRLHRALEVKDEVSQAQLEMATALIKHNQRATTNRPSPGEKVHLDSTLITTAGLVREAFDRTGTKRDVKRTDITTVKESRFDKPSAFDHISRAATAAKDFDRGSIMLEAAKVVTAPTLTPAHSQAISQSI